VTDIDQKIDGIVDEIDTYVDVFSSLEYIIDSYNIQIDGSPLINLRDALFHFARLVDVDKKINKRLNEANAIIEHLKRGTKDIIVRLSMQFALRVESHCVKELQFILLDTERKHQLQSAIYELDNIRLDLRSDYDKFYPHRIKEYIDNLKASVEEIQNLYDEWGYKDLLFNRKTNPYLRRIID